MIASAAKKFFDRHVHFRRRVSVREQRVQKYNQFSRGSRLLIGSTSIFDQPEHMKQCKVCQIFSIYVCRTTMSRISMYDGTSTNISKRNTYGNGMGGLYQSKLQDSVQLQTVLALYDQETVRNIGQPSYQTFKASVRLHIDETMRTRNFRVRSETVERGATSKSRKGEDAYVDRKVGECFQWKQNRQCAIWNKIRGSETNRAAVLSHTRHEGKD